MDVNGQFHASASLLAGSADERGGCRYELPGPGSRERGPGPEHFALIFVFLGSIIICLLYKLILPDKAPSQLSN